MDNEIAMYDLAYTYQNGNGNSNRLMKVTEGVTTGGGTGGFNNGTSGTNNDYTYDYNGNMTSDLNKAITSTTYNHLNLPTQVYWAADKKIDYIYNATGQKVKKTVRDGGTIKTVDYLDGFQYAGGILQFFPTAEGYVKATQVNESPTNPDYAFNYVFNYTDHLGNVRLSFSKDPVTHQLKIMEENHYYPFGLKHSVYAGSLRGYKEDPAGPGTTVITNVTETEYMYKYNGKEFQDELGLNWHDYGWRNYDATIGRWMNVDPLAEEGRRWSPYTYVYNNPLRFIDPDGMLATPPDWYIDARTGAVLGQDGAATNNARVIYGNDWDDTVASHGGSLSAEATSELQKYSSVITVNDTQIQSDINSANNETIADQTAERQVYIGLDVDKSGLVPTAELTSARGPNGVDGAAYSKTKSILDGNGNVSSKKFEGTNLVPIAQAHTHNESQIPNTKTLPGASFTDAVHNIETGLPTYAIDSYSGASPNGNNITRAGAMPMNVPNNPSGLVNVPTNVGTTSNNNIGQDALKNYINQNQ